MHVPPLVHGDDAHSSAPGACAVPFPHSVPLKPATHEQVNQLMVDCFGWPVGPFAMVEGAQKGFSDGGQ